MEQTERRLGDPLKDLAQYQIDGRWLWMRTRQPTAAALTGCSAGHCENLVIRQGANVFFHDQSPFSKA